MEHKTLQRNATAGDVLLVDDGERRVERFHEEAQVGLEGGRGGREGGEGEIREIVFGLGSVGEE